MARIPWLGCGYETGNKDEDGGIDVITLAGASSVVAAAPVPRSGTYALKMTLGARGDAHGSARRLAFVTAIAEHYGRIPFITSLGIDAVAYMLWRVQDDIGTNHLYLTLTPTDGFIRLYRGSPYTGTLLATATGVALFGAWNACEYRCKIADADNGVFQLWLNEVLVIDYSGVGADTRNAGNANVKTVDLCCMRTGNGANTIQYTGFDDVAFNDTTGAAQNARCMDAAVLYLPPNANGNSEGAGTAWDGSDGNQTDNHDLVDEIPAVTTDYVTSSDVNDVDTYNLADVPAPYTAAILVQPICYAALAAAGTGDIRLVVRSNGVDYPDAADTPLTTTYVFKHGDLYYVDPNGGGAWSTTKANALEAGHKVT